MIIKTSYPFMKPPPSARLIRGHRLAQGLVGFRTMAENGGLQVFDSSGYGNIGTLGGAALWQSGKYGSALYFNTEFDQIVLGTITEAPSLGVDEISIVCTIKLHTNLTEWCPVYGSNYDTGAWLSFDSGEKIAFYTKGDAAYDNWSGIGDVWSFGEWHHLVATYDGQYKSIYIDGILISTRDTGAKAGPLDWGANRITIGGEKPINNYNSRIIIDNLSVYNHALFASECVELYAKPFCMFERRARTALMSGYEVVAPTGIAAYTHHYQQAS